MAAERDRIAKALEREGVPAGRTEAEREATPRERAFAIATAQVRKAHRGGS